MKKLPKRNSIFIAICVLIIVIGFALMSGEPSGATEYNPDIFSFRRITLGPMIALGGFLLMIVAILFPEKKDKASDNENETSNDNNATL